jgi:iron complex transport system substrate-binding protein
MITHSTKSSKCRRYNPLGIFGMSFLVESTSNNLATRFRKNFSQRLVLVTLITRETAQRILSTSLRKILSQLLLLATLGISQTVFSIEVRDDEGSLVQLDESAQRIISLAPSLTELLYAAGAGGKLVGVVEYSDYPQAAKALPIIGRYDMLDMEKILQLQPDLVVAWQTGNPRAAVNRLRELGLTVYIAEPKRLESIPSHIRRLATLAGTEALAEKVIEEFDTQLATLSETYRAKTAVRTFYQVWDRPLISAGGNELINDIIELCGGVNIFADIELVAPKVSVESVLIRNPQAIVASGMDIERPEWLDEWLKWGQLSAVSTNSLFFVPPELLQRHTPRALIGAKSMCEQLDQARAKLVSN